MSDELYSADCLTVSRYCGPMRGDGGDRRRLQFCVADNGYPQIATLSAEEAIELVAAIARELMAPA
jgi:hypothetical protein